MQSARLPPGQSPDGVGAGEPQLVGSGPFTFDPLMTMFEMEYDEASKLPPPPQWSAGTQPVHSDPYRMTPLLCMLFLMMSQSCWIGCGLRFVASWPSLKCR